MKTRLFHKGISPIRVLPLGYLGVICVGTLLLMLPAASYDAPLPFLDALFTATSASCVTGLVVVDTGTYFTPCGPGYPSGGVCCWRKAPALGKFKGLSF